MRTLKKALCIVLALVMAVGLLTVAAGAKSLSDYSDANKVAEQFKVAVDVNTQLGVLKGRTDATYDPQGTLNRAELATIIYRIVTGDVKDEYVKNYADAQRFEDVAPDQWFAGYVNYCADNGYLKGVGEGKYDPAGTLTGYQAMAALLRALGYDKLHEYEGADWYVAVTKDAKKINEGIVADWAKPISREIAAQLTFNTLKATPVMYVAILGDYVESVFGLGGINNLLRSTFGVVWEGIDFDADGNPSYIYENAKGKAVVDMPLEPVATYTTKVLPCDLLVDAGVPKSDNGRYYAEFYANGAYEGTDYLTHYGLDCEDWMLDGQGVLTNVYDMSDYGYDSDFVISQIYYYLAKVTKVTKDAHGVEGNIELEVYNFKDEAVACVAYGEGYAKGDYVIVHPQFGVIDNGLQIPDGPNFPGVFFVEEGRKAAEQFVPTSPYPVVIDQKAESFQGKRSGVTVDVDAETVTYTIEGKEYNLAINYNLSATGPVVSKNVPFNWFFDLFGNLIGDIAVPAPATQYTVIDRIAYQANGLEDGVAPAKIVNMKAEQSQINVTSFEGGTILPVNGDFGSFGPSANLSQQWNQNQWYEDNLYVINGTDLSLVPNKAFGVNITKGIATIELGFGREIYGNKNTVYLYRTGERGAYTYTSYTGVTNAPTVVNCNIAYVANDNNYAEVVFVMVPPQPAQGTSGKFIVPEDLVPSQVVWINDNDSAVNYYVYTIYDLDGNPVQIKALTNAIEGAPAGLYQMDFLSNGFYDDDYTPLPGYFTWTVRDIDTYEGNVFVATGFTGMNQFDFVDAKIIVIGNNGIKTITPDEAAAYLKPGADFKVLDSEYATQSYSIVYIIP